MPDDSPPPPPPRGPFYRNTHTHTHTHIQAMSCHLIGHCLSRMLSPPDLITSRPVVNATISGCCSRDGAFPCPCQSSWRLWRRVLGCGSTLWALPDTSSHDLRSRKGPVPGREFGWTLSKVAIL